MNQTHAGPDWAQPYFCMESTGTKPSLSRKTSSFLTHLRSLKATSFDSSSLSPRILFFEQDHLVPLSLSDCSEREGSEIEKE